VAVGREARHVRRDPAAHAVILLSGGLDSTTALGWAKAQGFVCHALTVDYGQRHKVEIEAARRVARTLDVRDHRVVTAELRAFGGSALTAAIDVPKDRSLATMGEGIPVSYVPARNTVLLALALAYAETLGAVDLVAGMNALDSSGYPDCRPEFLRAFERVATLGTRAGVLGARVQIHAPLMELDKAGIVRLAISLGVDLSLTHSCYDPEPDGAACGACDACQLRLKGFREAGAQDPIRYRSTVSPKA
jgi:7-cyano-7-deazaguanine synthase